MKPKVRPDLTIIILYLLGFLILFGVMYYFGKMWMLILLIIALIIFGLFFSLLSVSANDNEISINYTLRSKKIPMSQIASAKEFPHSLGWFRIFGIGALGFRGEFDVPGEGQCMAYYSNPDKCVLVTLKNGKKYLLESDKPAELVEEIQNHIK